MPPGSWVRHPENSIGRAGGLEELEDRDGRYAGATVSGAAGVGSALLIERVPAGR